MDVKWTETRQFGNEQGVNLRKRPHFKVSGDPFRSQNPGGLAAERRACRRRGRRSVARNYFDPAIEDTKRECYGRKSLIPNKDQCLYDCNTISKPFK